MNYSSRNVRLFPIDLLPLSKEQISNIINKINEKANCIYSWNEEGNYLDILYVSKNMANYFLNIESLLSAFHYWQICGDEGYTEDTIMGQSKFYESVGSQEMFDYYSTCYYQLDNIRVNGNDETIRPLLKKLLSKVFSLPIVINEYTFEQNTKMIYTASNDRLIFSEKYTENKEMKLEGYLVPDGGIISVLSNSSQKFGPNQANTFHHIRNEIMKDPTNAIRSIELEYKGIVVHEILWNPNESKWTTKTGDFWNNCADSEYVKFAEWYRNERAIANTV